MAKLTSNMEDYLEAISLASRGEDGARVKDIGALLKVKNPSVTGALEVLEKAGLVVHQRYGKVRLSAKGHEIAAEVKKKHSLISRFLIEIVGLPPKVADMDACKIEHVISKETFEKLKVFYDDRAAFYAKRLSEVIEEAKVKYGKK